MSIDNSEEKKIRDTIIQIKTTSELKKKLGYIKVHEEKSFTQLFEEFIEEQYKKSFPK